MKTTTTFSIGLIICGLSILINNEASLANTIAFSASSDSSQTQMRSLKESENTAACTIEIITSYSTQICTGSKTYPSMSFIYVQSPACANGQAAAVEFSDASGNFASPTIIATGATVTDATTAFGSAIIPTSLPYGIGYMFRIHVLNTTIVSRSSGPFTLKPGVTTSLTNNGPITCNQPVVTLSSSGANTYSFSGPGIGQSGSASTVNVTQEGVYTVLATNTYACSATATTTVTKNANITATATASSTSSKVGTTVNLNASGGSTYQWAAPSASPLVGSATSAAVSANLTAAGPQAFTVLVSQGSCQQTKIVSVTATNGPDLTANIILPDANFSVGAIRNFAVNIFEVGWLPTAQGNISITVTVPVGYILAFDNSLNSINVSGNPGNPVLVNNSKWTVSSSLANRQLTLKINTGEFIGAAGSSALGFSIIRTTATSGSVSNITINISNDSGKSYDINPVNNGFARIISGL